MVDFTKILSRKSSVVKAPSPLPLGDYPGIIKSWKFDEKNRNKLKAPIFRFTIGLTDWPADCEDVDPSVKIETRTMFADFYADDTGGTDQTYRLLALAESLDIQCEGRELGEILPEMIGQQVLVEIQQYRNQQSGETSNQVGKVVALAD